VFEETAQQLTLLTIGATLAWQGVAQFSSMGTLPEDVAQLACLRTGFLPAEVSGRILTEERNARTGRWDTHPCLSERIANARATGFHGVLPLTGPAEELFRDLSSLC